MNTLGDLDNEMNLLQLKDGSFCAFIIGIVLCLFYIETKFK